MKPLQKDYQTWLDTLKNRVKDSQIKAAIQVNRELLLLYWEIGQQIIEKQQTAGWGDSIIDQLSFDLLTAFPGMKGFSRTNLFYIKKWVTFYKAAETAGVPATKVPQLVGSIPWGHNREIITKCSTVQEAIFYVRETISQNWSRSVLLAQLAGKLHERKGAAIHNFQETLPLPQADLAHETLKNPYSFDFLQMSAEYSERELETALIDKIQKFLLELGQGFAFVGRQYLLKAGISDFFLDLLFYHIKLKCYVVVELKTSDFQPEFAGKLNFYLNVVDDKLRDKTDNPTIGLLLCRAPDKIVVEYSLKNLNTPLGVAEYLPTVQAIQDKLSKTFSP
ncbi:PDDEXK nuclease domain-containing protein [Paraflavitalea sp. CAU 1676]|uniref:PDDEXK nuclease domain-containing protein n=1 Tax=Paraflavitalea sp. CAU 1676 TaxID=3032598 RepID=UPI0023DBC3D2|nr:PDDEXK nuclease domain-containing protein [Paraflavitalea sp. CAU 1676]MDF2191306.1 PDDEXK nuclease domain-containing protein [Paraflavitalea sp. CAU 1676]